VRVNKAGEKRGVAKVKDFGAGGACDSRADFGYDVAIDQDFARAGDVPGFNVKQARGVEDDGVRAWRRLRLR